MAAYDAQQNCTHTVSITLSSKRTPTATKPPTVRRYRWQHIVARYLGQRWPRPRWNSRGMRIGLVCCPNDGADAATSTPLILFARPSLTTGVSVWPEVEVPTLVFTRVKDRPYCCPNDAVGTTTCTDHFVLLNHH